MLVGLVLFCLVALAVCKDREVEVLYVWSGSGDTTQPDFVNVVDFSKTSPTYGHVLNRVNLTGQVPNRFATHNEPHHCFLMKQGGRNILVTGGLLSFLQGADDVFVWNLDNPLEPVLERSFNLPGGCVDEMNPFRDGLLVSMMCGDGTTGALAGAPGSFAYLNLKTGEVSTLTNVTDPDNAEMHPHGFDIHHSRPYFIATDYVLPYTLLPGQTLTFRDTMRRFSTRDGSLEHVYHAPGAGGFMDFRFIPDTTEGYSCGTLDNKYWYLNAANNNEPHIVFDLRTISQRPVVSAGIVRFTRDGLLIMTYGRQYLLAFDVSNRQDPQLVFVHDFCTDGPTVDHFSCGEWNTTDADQGSYSYPHFTYPGAHYLYLSPEEDRVVVSLYFLKFGILQNTDQSTIAVFNVNPRRQTPYLTYDPSFSLDMFPDRPHGVQSLKAQVKEK